MRYRFFPGPESARPGVALVEVYNVQQLRRRECCWWVARANA
jgi:hypothetical protein